MRIGINTFLFTSPFSSESTKLFQTFKRSGFDTVDIPLENSSHVDPVHVKRELDKAKLVCGSVCGCMGPDRDTRRSPEQQQSGLEYMVKLLNQTSDLNSSSLIHRISSAVKRADAALKEVYKQNSTLNYFRNLCYCIQTKGWRGLELLKRFKTNPIKGWGQASQMAHSICSSIGKAGFDIILLTKAKFRRKRKRLNIDGTVTSRTATVVNGMFSADVLSLGILHAD